MSRPIGKSASALESVIRYLRVRHGLSQAALARKTGLTACKISEMEQGRLNQSVGHYVRVARALGITVDAAVNNDFAAAARDLPPAPRHRDNLLKRRLRFEETKLKNGFRGERLVAKWEREKLEGTPYANAVTDEFSRNPTLGYDIGSVTREGEQLHIEVKATQESGGKVSFLMTAAELELWKNCQQLGLRYELHYVTDVNGKHPTQQIFTDLSRFTVEPADYRLTWRDAG